MDLKVALLLVLVVVIVIGFVRKINVGLLAIAAASIVAYASGAFKAKAVISGFNSSLFVTLMGVTLLFGVIQSNGCLDLLLKKLAYLFRKQVWFIPILLLIIGFAFAAVGPGCVPALAVVVALAIPLAKHTGYNPLMLMLIGEMGTFCGRFTAITPEGILISSIMTPQGYPGIAWPMIKIVLLGVAILSIIVYIYYGGYKIKTAKNVEQMTKGDSFTSKQLIAMVSILVMLVGVIGLKMNVGLASFIVAVFLLLIGIGDSKVVMKDLPWNTMVMVCGVGVLITLIISSGGIDLVVEVLSSAMTASTAAPIIGFVSGCLSWFSSALGVVFPTVMPLIGGIAQNVPGSSVEEMVSAVGIAASVAGLSPASTGGGLIMGAFQGDPELAKTKSADRLFIELFAWSVFCVVFLSILAFTGIYGLLI